MIDDAIQKVLDAASIRVLTIENESAAVCPDGHTIESLEAFRSNPFRVRENVSVVSAVDFIQYVLRYKEASSIIMVTPDLNGLDGSKKLARCVINYHKDVRNNDLIGGTLPQWCSHNIYLLASPSPEYQLLLDLDGKILGQADFAVKLRDIARFSTSHAAADLIEIVRTMALTSAGRFQDIEDDFSGSVKFGYEIDVKATAGTTQRKLEVPRTITFDAPLLLNGPTVSIESELLYRIPKEPGGKVLLGLRLPNRRWQEIDAVTAVAKLLRDSTGLLTMVGGFL